MLNSTSNKPRKSIILFCAGLVALVLFLSIFIRLYETPRGAYAAIGPMELVEPDGTHKLAPVVWFTGAAKDSAFKPGIYRFSFDIPVSDPDPREEWLLFFPQVYGNALRVEVGGQGVGCVGDIEKGDSNIWNPAKVFRVKAGLVGDRTSVAVEINGRYEAGITKRPYLLQAGKGAWNAFLFRFVTDLGVWGLCGAILAMGLVILILGAISAPRIDSRFLFGLAAVMAAFFLTDFLTLEYLPSGLLVYKRLVAAFRHLSAASFALAVGFMLTGKKDKFLWGYAIAQIVFAVLMLMPRTMPELKRLYNFTYLGIFPIMVYLPLALAFKRRRPSAPEPRGYRDRYGLLMFGAFAGMGSGIYDTVSLILRPGSVCISHYGFFALYLSVSAHVVLDILGHFKQLELERLRSERYQQEALRDHLTDAFNRKVLPLILEETRIQTAVAMLDLDDFKGVNDTYGHQVGDLVLKNLVAVMRRAIRQTDYLVRLGGDEFVIFLPGCPQRKLEIIVKHVMEEVASARVPVAESGGQEEAKKPRRETCVSYNVSVGTALSAEEGIRTFDELQTIIARADEALYKSKTSGKARATFG